LDGESFKLLQIKGYSIVEKKNIKITRGFRKRRIGKGCGKNQNAFDHEHTQM